MTIEDLSKLLKKSECELIIPVENFKGYAIAIDAGVLIYSKGASAYSSEVDQTNVAVEEVDMEKVKNRFFVEAINFLSNFIKNGIEPLLVFDGPTPIIKKEQASIVRGVRRDKIKTKLKDLEDKLSIIDPLLVSVELVNEKRKLMKQLPPYFGDWGDQLMQLCKHLGIMYAQSTEESDRLCAALVRDAVCIAAYTTDYDVLIHGCHLMLKGYTFMDGKESFAAISLEKFMRHNKLCYSMLVDLAITMGCDYNIKSKKDSIKRVGPVTALKLINQWKTIDKFPPIKTWSALKHTECRKIFYPIKWQDLVISSNFEFKEGKVCIDSRIDTNFRDIATSMGISVDSIDQILNSITKTLDFYYGVTHAFSPYSPFTFNFTGEKEIDMVIGEGCKTVSKPKNEEVHPFLL